MCVWSESENRNEEVFKDEPEPNDKYRNFLCGFCKEVLSPRVSVICYICYMCVCVCYEQLSLRVNETKHINKECLVVICVCHSFAPKYHSWSDKIDVLGERDNTMTGKRHYKWYVLFLSVFLSILHSLRSFSLSFSSFHRKCVDFRVCVCFCVYFQMFHWFCLSFTV